jgi:hemolysin activation/secretion protein
VLIRRTPAFNRFLAATCLTAAALLPTTATLAEGVDKAASETTADAAASEQFFIGEFRVLGNTTLPPTAIETAVYPFLGENRDMASVEGARDALVAAYRAAGFGTVLVDIPEQSVDDGVVRLQVTEGRVEKVRIAGARYYSEKRILDRLPSVKPGSVPKLPELQDQLSALATEARDREIIPTLKPGSAPGTLVVDFAVKDTLPVHGSLEANNRYTADTSELRLVGAVSYDNLFQRADSVGLMYQTSPLKPSEVQVGVANYLMRTRDPKETWSFYAVRSNSDVAAIGTLSVVGNGTILGSRYTRILSATANGNQTFSFGADWKNFGENIRVSADLSAKTPIHYLLWSAQYALALQGEHQSLQNQLTFTFALRGLGADDPAFEYKRAGAHAGFAYLRDSASYEWHAKNDWGVRLRLGGQYTEQPVISNEQFVLGGVDTVRGYLDAEDLVDAGLAGAFEVHAPAVHWRKVGGRMFAFYDRGIGFVQQPLSSEIKSHMVRTDLSGYGLGFRFSVDRWLESTVDWSHPVVKGTRTKAGADRVDFNLKFSF